MGLVELGASFETRCRARLLGNIQAAGRSSRAGG
jgi:hypothetical protein